jgi:hypothetical protein
MPKYRVPKKVQDLARGAVEQNQELPISQRAAYKDDNGKRVAGTGMRTARRLISGAVDEAQMILMRAWFARHGESDKEKEARRDRTSKASIAWRLWGGTAGRAWVKSELRDIERARDD